MPKVKRRIITRDSVPLIKRYLSLVPAARNPFLIKEGSFITTRTPLYYLDLPDPNRIMYKRHFEEILPGRINHFARSCLGTFDVCDTYRPFHRDDSSVGCKARRDSFLSYVCDVKAEKLDMISFKTFFRTRLDAKSLIDGELATRFLNFATICGFERWRKAIVYDRVLGDKVFSFIYPNMLKGIYKKKSEDPLLVEKFWDVFCGSEFTRVGLFKCVPDAEHLKFMLEVANQIRFDFWGLRNGGELFCEFLIDACIKANRCDLVIMMLDYGFNLGPVKIGETRRWRLENLLTRPSLIFTFKDLIPEGFMVWFLAKCYSICGNNLLELPGFVKLFRKLSRSSRLPSLPPSIVRKNLQKVTSSPSAVNEMTYIYEACDVYPADCSGVPPLSHLSRCFIRERLAANYQLPAAIDNFCIPEIAKRYLRLDY